MDEELKKNAIEYHQIPRPGKIEVVATKPLANQRDLALAYSPGVAAACELIVENPDEAASVTARANLVAVITNGTAVLGLGNIGPLAAKPVMEGKGVLFKKFAGIDVFDIEINEKDPDKLVEIIASLEPTFGGINLEDIKSPECFQVEGRLKRMVKIPVFHDDQHGTAIITGAAVLNALRLLGKKIDEVRLVASGAGAAAISCLKLLIELGMPIENILVSDRDGIIYRGRKHDMDPHKKRFARNTEHRTLAEAMVGADIFLGLSAPNVVTRDMVKSMADSPLIMALANPTPEILPEEVKAARSDALICTGRSDYPNQVNNVLCFPYIFRGALDVGATEINEAMKIACVRALAKLTMEAPSDMVAATYDGEDLKFGPEYLIPKPFDPRLILELAPAVAQAAMDSGVATRPIPDMDAYREQLNRYVFQSMLVMRPMLDKARSAATRRLAYADGEDPKVLRAAQTMVDEGLAKPILLGRTHIIETQIQKMGLRFEIGQDVEIVDPELDERYQDFADEYHQLMKRRGVTPADSMRIVRTHMTALAALLVRRGDADAMLCGISGSYGLHLRHLTELLGLQDGIASPTAMNVLTLKRGVYFICDTHVIAEPNAQQIASMTHLAAAAVERFGLVPKVALLSHSNFGSSSEPSAAKVRDALGIIREQDPDLEVEGEMHSDAALVERIRQRLFPDSRLTGEANVLIMPNMDAANIAMNLLTILGDGTAVGPILLGLEYPAHILTRSATVRRIINMSTLAVVDALARNKSAQEEAVA